MADEVTTKRQQQLDKVLRAIEAWDDANDVDDDVKNRLKAQLNDFIDDTEAQLKVRLNFVEEVPAQLEYIVVGVATRRFNIKGREGFTSYSHEAESMSIIAPLMDEYQTDINKWLALQADDGSGLTRSAARFI